MTITGGTMVSNINTNKPKEKGCDLPLKVLPFSGTDKTIEKNNGTINYGPYTIYELYHYITKFTR